MDDLPVYKLFVYGSLRRTLKAPAHEYMNRFFSFVADAKVKGKLFDLGAYTGAVPVSTENFIIGELYTIKNESEFDLAISQLDDYEEINTEPGATSLFKRELVNVFFNDASTASWIYWYNGNVNDMPLIESGDMIQYLREKNNLSATSSQ